MTVFCAIKVKFPVSSERYGRLAQMGHALAPNPTMASLFADGFYRESWLAIAKSYRDLLQKLDNDPEPENPKP